MLTDELNITSGCVIAVVGCGGKTSLIEKIAAECKGLKVLITPTTKILRPEHRGTVLLCSTEEPSPRVCGSIEECISHTPQVGVQYFGQYNEKTGKLEALPMNVLEELVPKYDIVLMEADGSRGLPLKGWRENEPVIPDFTTHTVGVVNLDVLGKPANEALVFNLPTFLSLTGLKENEPVTMQAIEKMLNSPNGMFKNSKGQKYFIKRQGDTVAVSRGSL